MKIKIHPLFFIFGLYFALCGKVFLFLNFALTAFIHEMGHASAMQKLGYKVNNVCLMPYGSVVNGSIDGLLYKDEIKIALSGPLLNVAVCLIFIALWWVFPQTYTYTDVVVLSNLSVASINLIPAFPLDGGRILFCTLCLSLSKKRAALICKILGILLSTFLLALFVYGIFINLLNLSLLFFALFIFIGSLQKNNQKTYVKSFANRSVYNLRFKECKHVIVNYNLLLKDIYSVCDSSTLFCMDITDEKSGKIICLNLYQTEKVLSSYALYERVGVIAERVLN
ncbi:MAG: hypothetical protein IJW13_05105 [Clostridia bacterium]|nr:hypothetical protein [Clostridia bacterium]